MSIREAIQARLADGSIFPFEVSYPRGAVVPPPNVNARTLYCSHEIGERLEEDDERWWAVGQEFLEFIEGTWRVTVRRLDHDRDADVPATMVRLEPRHADEPPDIWEMRPMEAEPPLRVFGGFAYTDTFVALTWKDREDLDFGAAMRECSTTWVDLFGFAAPLRGDFPDAYLSRSRLVP